MDVHYCKNQHVHTHTKYHAEVVQEEESEGL